VPARKKGIRLGFCQPPQTKEMGKGEDHDGEGFASTCTRRCRRSTSRSTGSDPCPPTLLDELPTEENPQSFSRIPRQTTESGSNQNKATIHRVTFRGEDEKSKDLGVGRRRAYLGADAVFADERRLESQRGEGVGGDGGVGALGMDGERI